MKLFDVYPLFDVNIVKGKGCKVWDDKDQEYLDLYGGHAVISVGHAHPHYVEKVNEQLNKLGFYSNSVKNDLQVQLAERLGRISGYDDYQLFLINSGAEANENALKLASFTNGRTRVLSAEKAFHGRTSLAVEVTNNPKIIAPINDNGHVTYLPMNDLPAWEAELAKGDVCAVILECIQGVGGIKMATAEFAQGLAAACKKYGTVLICDEIQCGYGRSGKFFAHQWLGIRPDIITVAKGIANGFPMGGVLIAPEFKPVYGQLGTTFGGNHLACAAALAVLDIFENEGLVENAHLVGEYLMERLKELQKDYPVIQDVRGRGLMIGVDLAVPHKEVRGRLVYEQHCFTGCAGTNILRLLPPLCLTKDDVDDFIESLINSQTKNIVMKIAVIGAGAMGGSTVKGLIATGQEKAQDITVSDPSEKVLQQFAQMGTSVTSDNSAAVMGADVVMVFVKPWLVEPVLKGIKDSMDYEKQLLVVVAAGVPSAKIKEWMGAPIPFFLVIPNIAIAQLSSMTFIVPIDATTEETAKIIDLFDEMGETLITDEQHLGAGTTLASCGIAYAMRYIRAAAEGGVELGFKADDAKRIVMQTVEGAVKLLEATGLHPEAAIDMVTTPGGVTIKGLNEMEHAGFTSAVIRGLKAGAK